MEIVRDRYFCFLGDKKFRVDKNLVSILFYFGKIDQEYYRIKKGKDLNK